MTLDLNFKPNDDTYEYVVVSYDISIDFKIYKNTDIFGVRNQISHSTYVLCSLYERKKILTLSHVMLKHIYASGGYMMIKKEMNDTGARLYLNHTV